MSINNARLPRVRRVIRDSVQALDRQGIAPWQAVGSVLVTGAVTAWLVNAYLSIRR
ncbi:hypothetical protein AB0C11_33490 [Streptomyces sp. NPDC039016]|uniref:hypothetical protein n=1 Tax=Streptomyces sp. NPDC039016 TaxID=3154330 RepID=UPI0033D64C25